MIKRRLIDMLKDAKPYIYINILSQIIALASQIVAVFFIAKLLDALFTQSLTQQDLIISASVFLSVLIVRSLASFSIARASFFASKDVKIILRQQLYEKLLSMGAAYRQSIATSHAVQLATEGVEQLELYFSRYLPQFFYSLIAPLVLFGVLSFISFKSALVLLLCVPLIPLSIVAVQKIAKKLLGKYWGIYTDLGESFLENLQGLTTLKIYQADEQKAQEMAQDAEDFRRITMRVLTMQLNSITIMDLIALGGAAAGIIVALNEYASGAITFAQTSIITLLAAEFFIPLRLLGSFFHIAMNGMAASDKMFELLDLEVDSSPKIGEAQLGSSEIIISDLNFSYTSERKILSDVNMSFAQKGLIAIAGKSGSGKSTIAQLIAGKYTNYDGRITLFDEFRQSTCRFTRNQ